MSEQPRDSKRPFQFRLVTALALMLALGVGGGMYLRYDHRRTKEFQMKLEAVAKLQPLADLQLAVTGKILDKVNAQGLLDPKNGVFLSKYGPSKHASLDGMEWNLALEFRCKPDATPSNRSDDLALRIRVCSELAPKNQGLIYIESQADPRYESHVERFVDELKAEYERRGWTYQLLERQRVERTLNAD